MATTDEFIFTVLIGLRKSAGLFGRTFGRVQNLCIYVLIVGIYYMG